MMGLIGILGFLAGPLVGIAVLAATMTTGIIGFGNHKAKQAAEQPKVFERVESYVAKKK
jgi:hypothetical protein